MRATDFYSDKIFFSEHSFLNFAVQQEMFEREIGRLRSLYQQQQQQAHALVCSNSRDLDAQFANLSQKHKDPNWGRDALSETQRPRYL